MSDDARILELVEEALISGRPLEEICAAFPDLLPALRLQVARCRQLDQDLDSLFPMSNSTSPPEAQNRPTQAMPTIPGYEIKTILGQGGVGVVYHAHHIGLDRPVALKMLLSGEYASTIELARFQREARAIAALRHPNIVQVYDVGDVDGRPYFTMELVTNGTLSQQLRRKPMPPRAAAALLELLADAANTAHQAGIIHRDLKPANILMSADGSPKISDFGLARQSTEDASLQTFGPPIGTPSYMAPEQLRGSKNVLGKAADIYALGVILYESLIGRPPFLAETATQTHQQILDDEPARPSRLNSHIPRDLETICLKCLSKEPSRRYPSAAHMAKDLRCFLNGEPIEARPIGYAERAWKWLRRHPATTVAIVAAAALAVGGTSALIRERAIENERWQAVEADLSDLKALQDSAQWGRAQSTLDRATDRLKGGGPARLVARVGEARRNLDLIIRLDAIHLSRVTDGDLSYYHDKADKDYRAAFHESLGIQIKDPLEPAAARIISSPMRDALIMAIDDWSASVSNSADRDWLLSLARSTQPDSADPWCSRIRQSGRWTNAAELNDLAAHVPLDRVPVSALLTLAARLQKVSAIASSDFLRRVQIAHPDDFWINLTIGTIDLWQRPSEAEAFCRAALASRPLAAVSYDAVGDALRIQQRPYEAILYYRKSLSLEPNYARAKTNLGHAFRDIGRLADALKCYDEAIAIDPHYAWADNDAGETLMQMHRWNEAAARYQNAMAAKLNITQMQRGLRAVQVLTGSADEALTSWQAAIQADPTKYDTLAGYAELSAFLYQDSAYERARTALLQFFPATKYSEKIQALAFACLLRPAPANVLKEVDTLLQANVLYRSTPPEWVYRRFVFNQAFLAYRSGDAPQAISLLTSFDSDILGPCPGLVLAMAQADVGEVKQARKTLAAAILQYDWRTSSLTRYDFGKYHVLRREAEEKLLPNLPRFLAGEYSPKDTDECIAMIGACEARKMNLQAAQLYRAALAARPAIADAGSAVRFRAACAAANAEDLPSDPTWSALARQWLADDLKSKLPRALNLDEAARSALEQQLGEWQTTPEFAKVRDIANMDHLPADERQAWTTLWQDVSSAMDQLENPH